MKKIYKLIIFLLFILSITSGGVYAYAFSPYFVLSPQAVGFTEELLPSGELKIVFDKSIDVNYYKDKIKISPEASMQAVINENLDEIIIKPKTAWRVSTQYEIFLPEGRTKNYLQIKASSFKFKTADYPKVLAVKPENGAVDVSLDIEEPIVVQFDKSTEGFFVDFRLTPEANPQYQNDQEKKQFSILSKDLLQPGKQYNLKIFIKAKQAKDETYQQIYETSFTTLPPKPKTWSQDLAQRIVEAKRFTVPRIEMGKYIDVNLSTQVMTIFENGLALNSFLISSGKRGMDTPKGDHQIYNKNPRPWSKQYGLYMPFWMAITADGKYGIHELPEWPSGYKEGQNHLGIPVSHGCMRLGVNSAETVYNWAEIGTKVVVY